MWQSWSLLSCCWSGWSLTLRAGLALVCWWSDLLTGGDLASRSAQLCPPATCVESKIDGLTAGQSVPLAVDQRSLMSWDECNPTAAMLAAAVVAPRTAPRTAPAAPPAQRAAESSELTASDAERDADDDPDGDVALVEEDTEASADRSRRERAEEGADQMVGSEAGEQSAALARLPRFYARLDLQDEQRAAVLATQAKHVAKLSQLRQQLRDAERERDDALASHLTPAQLRKLRQLQRPADK